MSYPINQKIIQYQQQPAMGFNTDSLQGLDADKIKQKSALNGILAKPKDDKPWLTPALTLPVWIAMAISMDKFNDACKGTYEESLVGRVGAWGDKIGHSKFFQSKPMQSINTSMHRANTFFMEKIVKKSKILSAMIHTQSSPTNKMVLMMKKGTVAELATEVSSRLEEYIKKGGSLTLDGVKLTLEDIEKLSKNIYTEESLNKIIKICEQQADVSLNAKNILKIPFSKGITGEEKYLSSYIKSLNGSLLNRKVYLSEYANKMKVFIANPAKTWLGKKLPKAMLRLVEGLTFGTAGGKLAVFMAAFFVADAIKKTMAAPKGNGEKRKTFAENLVYNESMYLTMPLGLKIMHGFGGLQYIGMTKEQVKTYRNKLKTFNEMAQHKKFTKTEYDTAKKELIEALKGDIKVLSTDKFGTKIAKRFKNILYKPLKFAGKLLTAGLESIRPYMSENAKGAEKILDTLKNIRFKMRDFVGTPLRFIAFLFVIAPPLGKIAVKGSHLIFGKPTKSVLDEGKENKDDKRPKMPIIKESENKLQTPTIMQPVQIKNKEFMNSPNSNNSLNNSTISGQRNNLLDIYNANSHSTKLTDLEQKTVRRYIPSSDGVKNQNNQDDKINALLIKTDKVEKAARQFIN